MLRTWPHCCYKMVGILIDNAQASSHMCRSSDLLLAIPLSKRQKSASRSLETLPESHYQDPTIIDQAALEFQDQDQISVARKYMEARQYTRAAHALRGCSSTKALFAFVYCQYIVSRSIRLIVAGDQLNRPLSGKRLTTGISSIVRFCRLSPFSHI